MTRSRPHHRKTAGTGGFTLLETIITVGLMAMILSVYLTVLGSLFFLRRLQFNVQAANYVQEEIETLRSLPFEELLDRTDGRFLGLPVIRGSWGVEYIDAVQGNAMEIDSAETPVIDETGLMIVPGNYREDFTYEAKVRVDPSSAAGWGAAIAFRYRDAENHYRFRITSGGIALDKVEHGTTTNLWTQNTPLSTGTWYTLTVVAAGTDITLSRDGVILTTVSDTTFLTGDLALMTLNGGPVAFDDISVTELTTTAWDFSAYATGAVPTEWQRLSYENLPGGTGTLTIEDYLNSDGIKMITVTVEWLDGLFPKAMTGISLIAE